MNSYKKYSATLAMVLMSLPLFAQSNCDPWIISIYKQEYKRQPTSTECNIQNYNNGSWNSYQQLTDYVKSYQNSLKKTDPVVSGDPWIMAIYKSEYRRLPNPFEMNVLNYNNGKWSSYQQLTGFIKQFQSSLQSNNIRLETGVVDENNSLVAFKKDGDYIGVLLVTNSAGKVVASGGGNVVAAGGGNLIATNTANTIASATANVVAAGGGNLIGAAGGNVIAAGGGNLRNYRVSSTGSGKFFVSRDIGGVNFGNQYSVQSGSKLQMTTSGSGSLIFK